jgi:hypothetical protein
LAQSRRNEWRPLSATRRAAQVSEHNRRYLTAAFELHDRVSDPIATDPAPAPPPAPSRPAPATGRHPNELVLRVLQAMSTSERVMVRLHDGGEHVGQITRRVSDGLVLYTGDEIPVARVCAITAAPLQPPARDRRDRRLAACAHTSATAATACRNPAATPPASACCVRAAPTTSASSCSPTAPNASATSRSSPPSDASDVLSSSASAISQPPTPTSPLEPPRGPVSTGTWRVKRSTATSTESLGAGVG